MAGACTTRLPDLPRRLPMTARIGAVLAVFVNWVYLLRTGV